MRPALLFVLASLATAQSKGPEQLFREAAEAQQRGDDALAVRDYQELVKLRPDMLAVRANLGAALAHLGRYEEAIAQYRAALALAPGHLGLRLNLALAYYKKGDLQHATTEFRSLHDGDPGNFQVAVLLGTCLERQGHDADAIAVLAPLEAAHAGDLDLAWSLGAALIHKGRLRDGLTQVQRVAEQGNSAEAWMLAGDTALRLNFFEQAQHDVDAAIRLNPRLPGAYTLRGRVLQYLGDDEGAVAALRTALQANANDFEAQLNLGAVLTSTRELNGARQHLVIALRLRPDSPLIRFEMARLERAEGKLEAAVKDMEAVVRANPAWLQPHIELAALYYRVKRPDDGARERAVVEQLSEQQRQNELPGVTPPPPSP
ncbi:MAG TPA: tetratricopeptide repeat protein [Bryobacteraceae bacterium]|nr:tetratricopeptide repeat protein [Bryobacteraceae bacterium]